MLCNTACPGTGPKDFINPHNINNFTGCTVIQGEIRILPTTFYGYALLLLFRRYVKSALLQSKRKLSNDTESEVLAVTR